MSPLTQGLIVLAVTLAMLLSGAPVAFGLGVVSIAFIVLFQGFDALQVVAETFYAGLNDFTLVSIPMFVMMGAAIGSSPAGKDLYEALDRWLYRLPGGLVISNLGACALFAALTGSSPATCAAIGKMGIPEMRKRGYPDDIATGSICAGGTLGILIPPSITFILYGIATETSIGRLFLAGVVPGLMLTGLFMLWTLFAIWRRGFRAHARGFPLQLEGEVRVDPQDRAVPRHRGRRDVRALRGRGHALGGGGRGRRAVLRAGRRDLPDVEPEGLVGDPARHHAGVGDDPDDHRSRGAVRLHADLALPHPDAGASHRRSARQPLGADAADQPVPAGLRVLHPAGRDHPDDQPDPAARSSWRRASIRCGSA